MSSLSETQQLLLYSMVRRIVGPTPNLELDQRHGFIADVLTHTWEPREIWLAPCGTAIVTIKLLFAEGNASDGRYVALCNCYERTHGYFLSPTLPTQTLATIHAYRAMLERSGATSLRRTNRIREQILRENLESSSDWGRLPPEDNEVNEVHYESDTEHTDPESGSNSGSVGSEDS